MQEKVLKTSGDPISCVHFTRASCHQTVIKVCSRTFRLSCTSHLSVPYFPSACIIPLYYNKRIFYLFTGCHECHSYTISWSHSMYLAVPLFSKQSKLISKIKYFSCLFVCLFFHQASVHLPASKQADILQGLFYLTGFTSNGKIIALTCCYWLMLPITQHIQCS